MAYLDYLTYIKEIKDSLDTAIELFEPTNRRHLKFKPEIREKADRFEKGLKDGRELIDLIEAFNNTFTAPPVEGKLISIEDARIKRSRYIDQFGDPDAPGPVAFPLLRFRMIRLHADLIRTLLKYTNRNNSDSPAHNIRLYPALDEVTVNGRIEFSFTFIVAVEDKDGNLITSRNATLALGVPVGEDMANDGRPCPPHDCPPSDPTGLD